MVVLVGHRECARRLYRSQTVVPTYPYDAPSHTSCRQDWPALMRAANKGRAEVVPVLVEAGADVNFQSQVGWVGYNEG